MFRDGQRDGHGGLRGQMLDRLVPAPDARDDRHGGSGRHLRSGQNIYRRASLKWGNLPAAASDHSRDPSFTRAPALASTPQSDPAPRLVLVAAVPSEPCQLFSYETSLCRRVRSDCQNLSFAVLRSWDFSREKSQVHVISFLSFAERSFSHDQSFPC